MSPQSGQERTTETAIPKSNDPPIFFLSLFALSHPIRRPVQTLKQVGRPTTQHGPRTIRINRICR